jgi:predicted AAA+ superfamily ATPase
MAEWLGDKVFPPLIKREAPDLVLERASEIIAIAGPRRAGKTCYMYQLIHDLLAQGNWSREDILIYISLNYQL